MNIDKYLERINYKGSTSPNLDNLRSIHKNHLYNIPFENLDIHSNKKIILDTEKLEEKILSSKRGGYCYELNGIFYALLNEMGYKVKMVSARVNNGKGSWGDEFDHMALVIELDDLWLADVGFGDNFIEPITIALIKPQKNLNGWFKISKYEDESVNGDYLLMSRSADNSDYSGEYIFKLDNRDWNEFEGMNEFHQTSPDSHFTRGRVCSIAKEGGRVTLNDNKLTITQGDKKIITEVNSEIEFNRKLYEYFKIEI
ncbi:MAG: arylamine N-acetyltransferase [Ignavibacteria bacterium]